MNRGEDSEQAALLREINDTITKLAEHQSQMLSVMYQILEKLDRQRPEP